MSLKKKLRKVHGRQDEKPDEGHLDETITNLAVTTSTSLRRHWKSVTAILVLACTAVVGLQLANAFATRRENRLRDRLSRWTSVEEDAPPDLAAIHSLVEDARGARAEKEILKRTVSYLLAEAERLETESRPESENESDTPSREDIFAAIESIVAEGRERFPADDDIARWASNIEKKLGTERDRSWLPPERVYEIQPPIEDSDTAPPGNLAENDGDGQGSGTKLPEDTNDSGDSGDSGEGETPLSESDGAPAGEPEPTTGGQGTGR